MISPIERHVSAQPGRGGKSWGEFMSSVSANGAATESKPAVRPVRKIRITTNGAKSPDQTDSDESQFFADMAQGLLGKDAGYALHLATGFEERTCYRYASGERMPPAYMLRLLIRSDHGKPWFNALMDGCTAPWWLEQQRAAEVGRKVLDIAR